MEELIKDIEQVIELAWERIDKMHESNRIRESKGERPYHDSFDFGKQRGYLNGLNFALEKIKQNIKKTKPTEPVTETGKR